MKRLYFDSFSGLVPCKPVSAHTDVATRATYVSVRITAPPRGGAFEWAQTPFSVTDYGTMTERQECLHFSRSNPPQKRKYWEKAFRAAGIIK